MTTAEEIVTALDLQPHPEGGFYREMFRDSAGPEARGASTAIYYLLDVGQRSHWHRVDAAEVWHWYAGSPLALSQSADGVNLETQTLGGDVVRAERP